MSTAWLSWASIVRRLGCFQSSSARAALHSSYRCEYYLAECCDSWHCRFLYSPLSLLPLSAWWSRTGTYPLSGRYETERCLRREPGYVYSGPTQLRWTYVLVPSPFWSSGWPAGAPSDWVSYLASASTRTSSGRIRSFAGSEERSRSHYTIWSVLRTARPTFLVTSSHVYQVHSYLALYTASVYSCLQGLIWATFFSRPPLSHAWVGAERVAQPWTAVSYTRRSDIGPASYRTSGSTSFYRTFSELGGLDSASSSWRDSDDSSNQWKATIPWPGSTTSSYWDPYPRM